jgi:hypothetical protein
VRAMAADQWQLFNLHHRTLRRERDATCFAVICVESGEVMDAPDTRAQAEALIKEYSK